MFPAAIPLNTITEELARNIFAMQKELDNTKWEEVVKIIPDMRKYSFVYNDTIRSGRFRGTETINYVSRIMDIYDAFREICPES